MLLLHTALVASLLLATATSITSRQQRSRELAQRLLEGGGGTEAAASFGLPVNGTALQRCGTALELPQASAGCFVMRCLCRSVGCMRVAPSVALWG